MINKLMVVAHPDDETLFAGGELIKHAKEYKVIVLDYGNHITRHLEFLRAMQMIGVEKWEHWDGNPIKHPQPTMNQSLSHVYNGSWTSRIGIWWSLTIKVGNMVITDTYPLIT